MLFFLNFLYPWRGSVANQLVIPLCFLRGILLISGFTNISMSYTEQFHCGKERMGWFLETAFVFCVTTGIREGLPGGTVETACQCRRHRRLGFNPWVGKIPWRRKRPPTPVFLPGESHGQRSLKLQFIRWKSRTRLTTHAICKGIRNRIHGLKWKEVTKRLS